MWAGALVYGEINCSLEFKKVKTDGVSDLKARTLLFIGGHFFNPEFTSFHYELKTTLHVYFIIA